jgi:hypothetical protein
VEIYNTAIQLNFTPPNSTNAIEFYECYANGKFQNEILESGQAITGLAPNTNYNITVVAVDVFYNKSVVSNNVNVSTMNGSITGLSVLTTYNNAIFFNFSTSVYNPSSYKWYSNGVLINTTLGKALAGLSPNTTYTNINVRAVDPVYGETLDSNTVISVTTTNSLTDVDANSYTSASLNTLFQYPINDFFKMTKDFALYSKVKALYPFLGTTQAQHKWNAKNPLDTNTAFRLVFSGTGTHSNLGYQCNGNNAYANTNFVPSVNISVANSGITIVSGTNNIPVTNNTIDFGSEQTTPFPAFELALKRGASKSDIVGAIGTGATALTSGDLYVEKLDIRGITTFVSTSLSSRKLFNNRILLLQNKKTTTSQIPTIPAYIGCLNNQGAPFGYSNQRIQFVVIHEGLTDTEVETLHTIIDAFETAIGRKTW